MQPRYVDCMHADSAANDTVNGSVAALPDEQIAYNVPHAAQVVDLSVRQMWELVRTGEIESFKIGASRRIPRSALVAYCDSHRDSE